MLPSPRLCFHPMEKFQRSLVLSDLLASGVKYVLHCPLLVQSPLQHTSSKGICTLVSLLAPADNFIDGECFYLC